MSQLNQFDTWIEDNGPAAIVLRQPMMPVEGEDGVLFPATYAGGDGFKGGYNIDEDASGRNVALIDSVGSQANRIEPIFGQQTFRHLVPQIVITAGSREVSILEAGHRAGDAIIRCSSLQTELQNAFRALLQGDAAQLATIAPTSLVFGVWDSRDTQAKVPRSIAATIRAFNVRRLTRGAQYIPAVRYTNEQLLDEPADAGQKKAFSERGFLDVPATATHGGVIADGGVQRTVTLAFAPIRMLHAGKDTNRTLALRRYILGLSLVALTHNPSGYLRQGCVLVLNPEKPVEFVLVLPTGERQPCSLNAHEALAFATAAAAAWQVGPDRTVPFDRERAKKDVAGEGEAKGGKKKGAKKAAEAASNE